jgi:DNA polymerase-1
VRPKAFAFGLVDPVMRDRYNARDALTTARLAVHLERDIDAVPELARTYETLVMPSSVACEQVEAWGVKVDVETVRAYQTSLMLRQDEVMQRLSAYGKDFNPGSRDQVADLLYKRLKLPPPHRTATGLPSTDADALELLAAQAPVVADIVEYRRVVKLRGTYADGLVRHVRADGRVHPDIKLDGTRTGRPSCADPNLQNIPRADSEEGKMARDCFTAEDGYELLYVDYSQLELRVAAMLSRDERMIDIFRSGLDYHRRTAEMIAKTAWGIEPSQIESKHRTAAKAVNFGVLYGQGPAALAATIGVTVQEAQRIMRALFGSFPQLNEWTQACLREARATGFIWTWWAGDRARRRPMWRLADEDSEVRSRAEHGSWNTPVQGTATEFCTQALVRVVHWILADRVPARLVLPVHDALLLEVRKDWTQRVAEHAKEIMLSFDSDGVPLDVDTEIGPAWGSLVKQPRAKTP